MSNREAITDSLALICEGIRRLGAAFPHRAFTIDGRLVGDVGEVIAALEYDLLLDSVQRADHDAVTPDGRLVQIKAPFRDHLTFRTIPAYYLGFKLYPDGRHEEIFNGPGHIIAGRYAHRKGIGNSLLSFPIGELRTLSESIPDADRVPTRSHSTS